MPTRAARQGVTNNPSHRLCTFDGFKNRRRAHSFNEFKKSLGVAGGHIAVIAANAYKPSVVLYRGQYSATAIVGSGRQNHRDLPSRGCVLWTFKNRGRVGDIHGDFSLLSFRNAHASQCGKCQHAAAGSINNKVSRNGLAPTIAFITNACDGGPVGRSDKFLVSAISEQFNILFSLDNLPRREFKQWTRNRQPTYAEFTLGKWIEAGSIQMQVLARYPDRAGLLNLRLNTWKEFVECNQPTRKQHMKMTGLRRALARPHVCGQSVAIKNRDMIKMARERFGCRQATHACTDDDGMLSYQVGHIAFPLLGAAKPITRGV